MKLKQKLEKKEKIQDKSMKSYFGKDFNTFL